MRFLILFILLIILAHPTFSQNRNGLYFGQLDSLKGSSWITTTPVNSTSISSIQQFGLTLWNLPIDSLKKSAYLWIFNDSLTINYFDIINKKLSTVLTCAYENNQEQRRIIFKLNDTYNTAVTFEHISVSTGFFVMLTKPKEKKKRKSR